MQTQAIESIAQASQILFGYFAPAVMGIEGKLHLLVAVEDFRVMVLLLRLIGKPEKKTSLPEKFLNS